MIHPPNHAFIECSVVSQLTPRCEPLSLLRISLSPHSPYFLVLVHFPFYSFWFNFNTIQIIDCRVPYLSKKTLLRPVEIRILLFSPFCPGKFGVPSREQSTLTSPWNQLSFSLSLSLRPVWPLGSTSWPSLSFLIPSSSLAINQKTMAPIAGC